MHHAATRGDEQGGKRGTEDALGELGREAPAPEPEPQRLDQLRLQIDSVVAGDDDAEMEKALGSSELTESPVTEANESEFSE